MNTGQTFNRLLLFLLVMAILSPVGFGKKPFRFERISIEDGLSQVSVYSILKDHDGFMWFGTQEGLNRFDGYQFSIFWHEPGNPNSLGFNTVIDLKNDRRGNIWIATFLGGLNRYDTHTGRFYRYQNDPVVQGSLSYDLIRSIVEDAAGRIWIGTDGGGLNLLIPTGDPGDAAIGNLQLYDTARVQFLAIRHSEEGKNTIGSDYIKALCKGRDGEIWIGTHGGGLTRMTWNESRFNREWFSLKPGIRELPVRFERFTHDPANPASISDDYILAIHQDRSGVLWVGTAKGGLNRFNRETWSFSRFTHNSSDPGSLGYFRVTAIMEDRSGYLWVGTGDGLDVLAPDREQGKKLFFSHYKKEVNNPYSLSDNLILCLYEDPEGIVWIGTEGGGISTFNRKKYKFDHYTTEPVNPHSLSDPVIRCILEDREGRVWVSTSNGLNRMKRDTGRFDHFFHTPGDSTGLSNSIVRVIFEDRLGNLWFGSENGNLDKLIGSPDAGKLRFEHFQVQETGAANVGDESVISIDEDRHGALWIGTHGKGISRFFPATRKFIQYRSNPVQPGSLSYDIVRFAHEDSRGRLWVGTDGGGLNRFDRSHETFTVFLNRSGDPESLSSNYLLCSYESPALPGILWIGTHGGGLVKMNLDTGKCISYNKKDGLPNNVVYGILEAIAPAEENRSVTKGTAQKIGKLWLSTNNGLCEFDPVTLETRSYNRGDGLQSDEFNGNAYYKGKSGQMYFGGLHGFNVFHPFLLASNPHVPPIVLTGFSLFHRPVPLTSGPGLDPENTRTLSRPLQHLTELRLSHRENFFSFRFAALDFTAPGKNRYSYQLEGVDRDWVECDAEIRQANYTGIRPGIYTFKVKGSNNDGIWNEKGAALKIIIKPPFWQTPVFNVSAVIFGLVALIAFISLRVNAVKRRAREEQARMKREMEKRELEKELKMKADWTSMLVHELRSPLTAILGYSDLMAVGSTNREVVNTSQLISRSSDRMLAIINDMLDISKFEAGKMKIRRSRGYLQDLVNDVVKLMTPLTERKNLSIKIECGKLPPILLDLEKVRQVIDNLMSNAIKFSPPGSTITHRCRETWNLERRFLELSVIDEGPGVPVESRLYLFDKYAQVHQDVKITGTGLGLAVSRLIIDAHGGEIGYRSPGGRGSVFYFTLPVDA